MKLFFLLILVALTSCGSSFSSVKYQKKQIRKIYPNAEIQTLPTYKNVYIVQDGVLEFNTSSGAIKEYKSIYEWYLNNNY